jgi:hypothetical protein
MFLSLCQSTVLADLSITAVFFLWVVFVQVAAPKQFASRRSEEREIFGFKPTSVDVLRAEKIGLKPVTSYPNSASYSYISSTGAFEERCLMTAFTDFWNFGKRV